MLAGLTAWKQIIAALLAGRSYPFFKRLWGRPAVAETTGIVFDNAGL